ncbi:MAG: anti-sigma factor, partial [Acidimicrobiaceae bacterium]|nr:anti-sigma factor [Acidimicrobiaceae bacterium]
RRSPIAMRVGGAVAAAAAVAAIAILGAEAAHLNHRVNQAVSAASNQGLSGAAQAALLDPQAQRFVLHGAGGPTQQVAEIVAQPSGAAFVFNRGLRPLAAEKTYQLWSLHGSQAVSLGLLGRDPTTVALHLGSATTGSSYAVTVERAGGAVAPTSAPVASTAA